MLPQIKTVLFDLDGTLADTAPDMGGALNMLLVEEGLQTLPDELIRNQVSKGGAALIRLGFGDTIDAATAERLRLRFLDIYNAHLCVGTTLFPGMHDVLDYIESSAMSWGVVTNKPGWLTDPLMRALNLYDRAVCVISGDTLEHRKPHPQPLLHACELAACEAAQCVFIGDDARDIEAGNAAGTRTLVARYGYIDDDERPEEWGAHGGIDQALDLISVLEAAG